ncbi:MAG: aspartate--tRNA ligase, partial [Acidimicrobiales bacterium]
MRSDYCGALRPEDAGRQVTVCGWVARRREHGEHLAFVDLRDHTGVVQCVVDGAHDLRQEYVLAVTGTLRVRPDGTDNPAMATGQVEVGDCTVTILATAEPPPFPVDGRREIDETLRLRHRYVDLRQERMQRNLRLRARVNSALRRSMESQGFVEVETPMLIASTPEGARDFVVPSRLHPGAFYALPQSPQLFKQLCMVGGIDRYFQLARCLRDEDLRADRQFEFVQLDVEASFVDQADILGFVTEAVAAATEEATGQRPAAFASMTWTEAMDRFGSDKPDVRFAMELTDLGAVFAATGVNVLKAACVKALSVPGGAAFTRSRVDALVETAKRYGAKGLAWAKVGPSGALEGGIAKVLGEAEQVATVAALAAAPGDLVLLVADERRTVNHVLGLLRLELGRPPVNEGGFHFLWVTEFPLFEGLGDEGRPIPAHHPFTMPHPDDIDRLDSDPLSVRSQAYDLVLNGWELGSGSIRIHEPELQQRIFGLLGISPEEADRRFGFFLSPFRYGAPPHGGFAFGID